jgi:DNA-binding transcriptional LysR family regulator
MTEVDLNLLRIFDALMELRSVTRAARHVGVTQSAVSHALARLRRTLDDPLFLRGPTGLQPTARAEEMAAEVRQGLLHFQRALTRPSFDPARSDRRFVIATGAYFCALLIPSLVQQMRMEAPGISLRIVPLTEAIAFQLDHGAIDLALAGLLPAPSRFVVEPLQDEAMVWIASATNPIARAPIDAVEILAHPRVLVAARQPFEADARSADEAGGAYGSEASATDAEGMVVYDSHTAVAIVARTDLVALVPSKVAASAAALNQVSVLDVSGETYGFTLSMTWHARQRSDAGLEWLRSRIRRIIEQRDEPS